MSVGVARPVRADCARLTGIRRECVVVGSRKAVDHYDQLSGDQILVIETELSCVLGGGCCGVFARS